MASLFTKIINGEIPSHKVYEDDKALAIMDINPIQPGQVLVISKVEVESFEDLPPKDFLAVMSAVQKVAKNIKREFKPIKVGVIIEGFEVPHVHVKVFPINSEVELRQSPDSASAPSHDELAATAQRLKVS